MGGKRNRVLGRCAGILFLTAALASLPANQLLSDPRPEWWIHLIELLGAATGAVCLLVPWDRISRHWLHLLPPVAVAEIVLSVSALSRHGEIFLWFFILNAVFVGYAFRRRVQVVFHMGVAGFGIVSTAVAASGYDPDAIPRAIVGIPTIWVACGVVVWLRENLERRERTDPLTGLANRRALMEALDRTLDLGQRRLLALFDLDGFKRYNDQLGHAAGDALLERLGARLLEAVGDAGEAFRLGGDELCVLLADSAVLTACSAALCEDEIRASHGTAWLPHEARTASAALRLADDRMYAAKRAARESPFVLDVIREPSAPVVQPPTARSPSTSR